MMSYFNIRNYNTYFEFIVHKHVKKYLQLNKFTELRYHGIANFVTVSKNDIALLLNFGILQSLTSMIAMVTVTQYLLTLYAYYYIVTKAANELYNLLPQSTLKRNLNCFLNYNCNTKHTCTDRRT